jgi:hypothetical protein
VVAVAVNVIGATAVPFVSVPSVEGLIVMVEPPLGLTTMVKLLKPAFAGVAESVTLTVGLNVPAVVGVPLMAPVVGLMVNPGTPFCAMTKV